MPSLDDVVHVRQVAASLAAYLAPTEVICLVVLAMDLEIHDGVQYLVHHSDNFDSTDGGDALLLQCAAAFGSRVAVTRLLQFGGIQNYVAIKSPLPALADTAIYAHRVPAHGFYEAVKRGDQCTVEWLHPMTQYEPHEAMAFAAVNGHLDLAQWIGSRAQDSSHLRPYSLEMHCLYGDDEGTTSQIVALTWTAHSVDCEDNQPVDRKYLATRNHGVAPVQRRADKNGELKYVGAMDFAASCGDLRLLRAMHGDADYNWSCTSSAMDKAASSGHLAVVQWLAENPQEGCTTHAVDGAARHGHLAILQWLQKHQKMAPTSSTLLAALEGGHLAIAQWIYQQHEPHLWKSSSGLVEAACVSSNRLIMLQWLDEVKDIRFTTSFAMATVLGHGDKVTAQWLADPTGDGANLSHWNQKIAKWLSYTFALWHHGAITNAALNGHVDMVAWLSRAGPLHVVERDTLWQSALRGHLDVVELLLQLPAHQPKDVEFVPRQWSSFYDAAATDIHQSKRLDHRQVEWHRLACDPKWAKMYVLLWIKYRPDACKQVPWLPRWARASGHLDLVEQLTRE